MNRRTFLKSLPAGGALVATPALFAAGSARGSDERQAARRGKFNFTADVVIAGGGLGGCAAALAALRHGLRVVLTEETDWIGGQLTQQGVPPDEHAWIESFGCTKLYREFRAAIRDYYRKHYPLTDAAAARAGLNPGNGSVSRLCHEPRVALAVLYEFLNPFIGTQQLTVLLEHKAVGAEVDGDNVRSLQVKSLRSGHEMILSAPYFVDATELGDLLPLTKTEFVTGAESRKETGELHAPEKANPNNQQAFTVCFAMDYLAGENHVIAKPDEYSFWRDFVPQIKPAWPGRLLSLTTCNPHTLESRTIQLLPGGAGQDWFSYRRIASRENFRPETYRGDITIVNWPQNDYLLGPLIGLSEAKAAHHIKRAKQLSLSLLYWLQTEAPHRDGKTGFPGLRLRGDLLGTEDGLAKYPYIREARRIKSVFTVLEKHVGKQARAAFTGKSEKEVEAEFFPDSVGLGSYNIDLHPSTGGDNYIDVPNLPFQIPLGALLPQRVQNLLPANKNIGTTHITNGCYRLHPVEWNIGESVGALVAFALQKKTTPHGVRGKDVLLAEFQDWIRHQGIETQWPEEIHPGKKPG
ncbi:MAG: FAD-dependent oxidoreductase [Verrucomicrobiota bacterium]